MTAEQIMASAAVVQAISTVFLAVQVYWFWSGRRAETTYERTVRRYTNAILAAAPKGNTLTYPREDAFHIYRAVAEGRLIFGRMPGFVELPQPYREYETDDEADAG